MNDKIKLMAIGDGGVPTGISRVIKSILINLPNRYDIHHLAVNYSGDPHNEAWKMYPAGIHGDIYGFNRVSDLIAKVNPELVFIVNDPWVIMEYLNVLYRLNSRPGIVVYMAVDSGPIDFEWIKHYQIVDRFVVYTEFARAEFLKAINLADYKNLVVIPHGVDKKAFFPAEHSAIRKNNIEITSSIDAKKYLNFYNNSECYEHSFVVLNANRNQSRKRIDMTIKGFSEFAKNKPDNVNLYLHMGMRDVGWDIFKLAKRYGIAERLIVTSNSNNIPDVSDEDLNVIYNACDVGVNTASCEGWGLCNFEHAATLKAQVVPRVAACNEIWKNAADFLEPRSNFICENILTDFGLVDYKDLAGALDRLYNDAGYRGRIAQKCYDTVTASKFDWGTIADTWHNLFQNIISERNQSLISK